MIFDLFNLSIKYFSKRLTHTKGGLCSSLLQNQYIFTGLMEFFLIVLTLISSNKIKVPPQIKEKR